MSRSGKRIIVIGELNIDLVAGGLTEVPQLGREILASDFQLRLGSASAIFACGVAKLGHDVTFVSTVGRDEFGDFCLRELSRSGISTRHITRDKTMRTGVTISLSTKRDRALVTYPGAIAAVGPHLVKTSMLAKHQHLHMTSYFLQTGLRTSFAKLFRNAKKHGLTTSFDPNCDPSQTWGSDVEQVLEHTDLLFVNQDEATKLTRKRNVQSALKKLGELVACTVIKLGDKGALAINEGQITSSPSFKVAVKDTTGAGDSFAAGFVHSWLQGDSLEDNLRKANACGALSTERTGGTAGQPDRRLLDRFLRLN